MGAKTKVCIIMTFKCIKTNGLMLLLMYDAHSSLLKLLWTLGKLHSSKNYWLTLIVSLSLLITNWRYRLGLNKNSHLPLISSSSRRSALYVHIYPTIAGWLPFTYIPPTPTWRMKQFLQPNESGMQQLPANFHFKSIFTPKIKGSEKQQQLLNRGFSIST